MFYNLTDLFSPAVLTALFVTFLAASATLLGGLAILNARESNPRLLAFGLSFAGGAMVYISLVEIFVKSHLSFSHALADKPAYTAATIAFFCGVGLLVLLDRLVPNPHLKLEKRVTDCDDSSLDDHSLSSHHSHGHRQLKRVGLMATFAITAHNFPEGMATFFATLDNPTVGISLAAAIAIHNIPEGISIAIPVYYATGSKYAAIMATLLSGLAEPVGALIGYLILAPFLSPFVYGSIFGIIAGAMVYLALDELLPSAQRYARGHETVYGMVSGMAVLALSLVLFR